MKHTLPLADKRILITRSKKQATYFSARIQALGGTSLEVPLIQFSLPSNHKRIQKEIACSVPHFEWIVFTSVNGVHFFFELYNERLTNRIATVGKKTKEALHKKGYATALMPAKFTAEDLAAVFEMEAGSSKSSVLLIQGNLARPVLREELMKLGYNVKQIIVYENHLYTPLREDVDNILKDGIDLITFTSPSTVKNFDKIFGKLEAPIAVIGPVTKKEAEKLGYSIAICPEEYTIDGLIEAIQNYFQREDT